MNDRAPTPGLPAKFTSRIAIGCMAAFMLPFFIAGASMLFHGWRELRRGAPTQSIVTAFAIGCLFSGVALTVFFAAIWAVRATAANAATRAANPQTPWSWRADWAAGVIRENGPASLFLLWPFAIFWNLVSLPVWFIISRELARQNRAVLFTLLFPIIGACLLAAALFSTARRAKYGASTCTLDRIPLQPGRTFQGELRTRARQRPEEGFRFTLTSLRLETRGSGKSRTVIEHVLWQEASVVSASVAAPSPDGMRVPFSFELPPDGESTGDINPSERIVWRLHVTADVPGIDYDATFELPVFRTGDDPELAEKIATYRHAHREEFARRELSPKSQVTIESLADGGTAFRIKPRRDFGSVLSSLTFLVVWCGAIVGMVKIGAPILFPIFFGLFALLMIIGLFDAFFGRSYVTVSHSAITIRRSVLMFSTTRTLSPADLESITPKPVGSGSKPLYDIELRLPPAQARALGCYLKSHDDAEIVAARMWTAAGRE